MTRNEFNQPDAGRADQVDDPVVVSKTASAANVHLQADQHMNHEDSQGEKPGWRTALFGSDVRGASNNASWSSIFVGLVITLAVLAIFSFLGVALGLGIFDLQSSQPFEGMGVGMIIWLIVTLLVAFGLGGYVAGALAVRGGAIHGLATFASSLLAIFVAGAMGISAAFGIVGNVVGGVASAVGSGASSVASAVGDGIGNVLDVASDNVDVDGDQIAQQTEEILIGTGVEELHPDYLENQLDEAGAEIQSAAEELIVNPEDYEAILGDLSDSLGARVENIADSVDRDAIVNSVEANTDLTGDEAEQAVDNAVEAVENGTEAAKGAIESAQEAIPEAAEQAQELVEEARVAVDEAASAGAKVATWAFVGLLIAALFTAFMGALGSRTVVKRDDSGKLESRKA